jgi:carbon storage regulator CsrA
MAVKPTRKEGSEQMVMMTGFARKKDTCRLVLSRKHGEEILIGDDIRVTIIQSRDGRVKLSVEAPASVKILRSEIAGIETVDIPK